ncbi:DUF4097 family beta strand repeat-containing protein [Paenibacillus sp. GYB006]|uniref:DUF4097 family beta strand repeat-containing protein n=1 Tax=Paenibacillus sp. GYB006 TaxID=2994394 RepID=UPI002F96C572
MIRRIWIAVFTGLFLCIGALLTFNSLYATELHHTKTLDAADIKKINIRTELLDVTLYESKDEHIHASISGYASKLSSYDIHIVQDEHTLNIRSLETNAVATSVSFSKTITLQVYLPSSMLDDLSIYTTFGSLYADENMDSKQLTFKSTLGGVYLEKVQAKKLVIDTSLGNIQINHLSGEAQVHTDSGNISILNWEPIGENQTIHTNKGNIHISLAKPLLQSKLHLYTNGHLSTTLDVQHIPYPDRFSSNGIHRIYGTVGTFPSPSRSIQIGSDTGQIIIE